MTKLRPRLYLDIDNVLNSDRGFELAKKEQSELYQKIDKDLETNRHELHKLWDKEAVNNLKTILETINPDVYIHSNWRIWFELDDFKSFFNYWGLNSELIKGIVPRYRFTSERFHNLKWHIEGQRILEDDEKTCVDYVVIDDIDMRHIFEDMDVFKTRQVVPHESIGLSGENVKEVLEIFKKNKDRL